jgi:hypothetical protein
MLAEFYEIDNLYVLCSKPPASVLFKQNKSTISLFEGLAPSVVPVFPLERSVTLKGYSVRRKQVPMSAAFCLTDYKVQGSTLGSATSDLKMTRQCAVETGTRNSAPPTYNCPDYEHAQDFIFCRKLK